MCKKLYLEQRRERTVTTRKGVKITSKIPPDNIENTFSIGSSGIITWLGYLTQKDQVGYSILEVRSYSTKY